MRALVRWRRSLLDWGMFVEVLGGCVLVGKGLLGVKERRRLRVLWAFCRRQEIWRLNLGQMLLYGKESSYV